MRLVTFGEQQFRQVRTVLTGDAGEEGFFHSCAPFISDGEFGCCGT
jgi:hypothetical protein